MKFFKSVKCCLTSLFILSAMNISFPITLQDALKSGKKLLPDAVCQNLESLKSSKFKTIHEKEAALEKSIVPHYISLKGNVKGIVTDENGHPIKNAKVTLTAIRDQNSEAFADEIARKAYNNTIETNVKGIFSFSAIELFNFYRLAGYLANEKFPKNNYRLSVEAEGYDDTEIEFVSINNAIVTLSYLTYGALMHGDDSAPALDMKQKLPSSAGTTDFEFNIVLKRNWDKKHNRHQIHTI